MYCITDKKQNIFSNFKKHFAYYNLSCTFAALKIKIVMKHKDFISAVKKVGDLVNEARETLRKIDEMYLEKMDRDELETLYKRLSDDQSYIDSYLRLMLYHTTCD